MKFMKLLPCLSLMLFMSAGSLLAADEKKLDAKPGEQTVTATTTYKASTIMGMAVKNLHDEKVGSINELVIDTPSGEIKYAALSVGGFLGIGDKLFAVPWKSMSLKHDAKGPFFVLDVDKDKLRNAPGFDKDHWPDVADPKFGHEIDKYYGSSNTKTASGAKGTTK